MFLLTVFAQNFTPLSQLLHPYRFRRSLSSRHVTPSPCRCASTHTNTCFLPSLILTLIGSTEIQTSISIAFDCLTFHRELISAARVYNTFPERKISSGRYGYSSPQGRQRSPRVPALCTDGAPFFLSERGRSPELREHRRFLSVR